MFRLNGAASGEAQSKIDAINRSQAVIEFSLDGTILNANENFLAAMGYGLEEIVGKHHSMFVPPDYAGSEAYRAFWKSLAQGVYQADEFTPARDAAISQKPRMRGAMIASYKN